MNRFKFENYLSYINFTVYMHIYIYLITSSTFSQIVSGLIEHPNYKFIVTFYISQKILVNSFTLKSSLEKDILV